MNREVGRRVHRVIGALAGEQDVTPATIVATVAEMWRADPVGGTVASSARVRCSSSVAVYFDRFRPAPQWRLDGVEVRLDAAVADLVWRGPRSRVLIDEVKSGATDVAANADQLERLAAGGRARWPGRFVGVRLVPLGAPTRSAVVTLRRGRLVPVPNPLEASCR